MDFLRKIYFCNDSKVHLKDFNDGLLFDNYQIGFDSIEIFNKIKKPLYEILNSNKESIKSFKCPITGDVFSDTVSILSELEDKCGINIEHIVIPFTETSARSALIEFYIDYKEICLQSDNCIGCSPIDIIAYLERHKYSPTTTLGLSSSISDKWIRDRELFYAIKPYISCIDYCDFNTKDLLSGFGYNKMVIK